MTVPSGEDASRPVVRAAGAELRPPVAAALRSVTVDSDLNGPDSCRLVLDDPARDLLDASGLDLGTEITVSGARVGDTGTDEVFSGVVHALAFEYDEDGARGVVTAYDRSYALYNGLHTKTYQNVTDSDLATQVAREAGLQAGRIDATSVVHEHVSQVNETHVDLLSRRARRVDRVLRVSGGQLDFMARTDAADGPQPGDLRSRDRLQLVPGRTVQRLTVRVTSAQQVKQVRARGWDPETKAEVVATVDPATRSASLRDTPTGLAGRLGGERHVVVDVPLSQQAECDALAQAHAERIAAAHVHAEGVAHGDPRLVAGTAVSLGATGGRFDGQVTLTRAVHTWDRRGYRTHFVASGEHERSLYGLLRPDGRAGRDRVPGVVIAVVTNAQDPQGQGRVRVRFPWLDDDYESFWARVAYPGAGAERGLMLVPEVDDEVVVAFQHGDPRHPVVVGGLWNGVDAPPEAAAVDSGSGAVLRRTWRSRTGHEVVLDDADDGGGILVRTGDGKATLHLDSAGGKVLLTTDGDVEVSTQKSLTVAAKGDLTLSTEGKGTFSSTGDLTLEAAGGNVVVKGIQIKLN